MILDSLRLFLAFFKVGLFGWAGGTALIPLIEYECITNNAWLTREQFAELIAVGSSVPGVFAVKLAGYIGYRISGPLGLLASMTAIILPGLVLLFLVYGLFLKYQEVLVVKKIMLGIKYGAAGFIAYSIFKVLPYDYPDKRTLVLGLFLTATICVALRYKLNPIIAIISSGLFGLLLF
jgi:chromate transporter